ncbi:MAG: mechanosensitive ion channel family protein [Acidobacteriota bacterium]|nr:mechanosensitive ion channel family protein [Acidobacteriota bacterium]
MEGLPFLQRNSHGSLVNPQKTLVDETPWSTAQALTAMAVTREELGLARDAELLADHDVDQAFAAALRKATLQQKTKTSEALDAQQHVAEMEAAVAADQAAVTQLTPKGGDDLDLAKAQLDLDQDQLADARADLARASGDQRGEIQQELNAREADMKKFDATQSTGEVATVSVTRYRTLVGLIGAWRKQNERYALLLNAKEAANQIAATLSAARNQLEAQTKAKAMTADDVATKRIAGLNRLSLEHQLILIDGDRVVTEKRLATIYDRWAAQVGLQHRILEHLILVQVMWIAAILIFAILINAVVRRVMEHESIDPRRMRTMSKILRLVIQIVALISILLVVFGAPSQLSTVIGLTTAGLTVALQDFILGFVGWFFLIGRIGIAVGDVVEIDGVTGEVIDIGLFRTTLMETGNWTANGHPTGRRVAFNNKYAISGKFFNFTTAGQWMWDELTVNVPQEEDTYAAIGRIHETIAVATHADAEQAEREWRQTASAHSLAHFSPEPTVNLRPSGANVELVVRYVTRASNRFEQRNKLYQLVLDGLHASEETAPKQS